MRHGWIVLLLLLAPLAQAATTSGVRVFVDRCHVSLGDTVTLNIQSSGTLGTPDLSPLQKDFQVLGTSRSSSVEVVNGKTAQTSQLGIALKPLHAGTLTIPPLDVGGAHTQPLTVEVGAAPVGGSGKVGDPVFMETNVLSSSPYVDQQTVYTVRLFYQPGVDGSLGDPSVSGARLVQLDRDHRYSVMRDGYAYNVIERSWALIPQRTGAITVDGPVFEGQQMAPGGPSGMLNNPFLNGGVPGVGAPIRTTAPEVRIAARAIPANAGKPWLPAREVKLKLTGLPANGAVDAAAPLTITLSIGADGQPADALPEPELPHMAGARVYPDQTRDSTDAGGQWLKGTRTRSFAVVPDRNGTLRIPEITLDWWNVDAGRAEQASVPAHVLQVSGVATTATATAPPPAAATAATPAASAARAPAAGTPAVASTSTFWRDVAVASLALWIIAIIVVVALWWRRASSAPPVSDPATPGADADRGSAVSPARGAPPVAARATPTAKVDLHALQWSALDAAHGGDPSSCEHALLAWARATHREIAHASALRDALADPVQRDALDALQRVRWHGGDAAPACAAVAAAFAHGFAWRGGDKPARVREPDLPPLYPT